jgi:hypothetical protein
MSYTQELHRTWCRLLRKDLKLEHMVLVWIWTYSREHWESWEEVNFSQDPRSPNVSYVGQMWNTEDGFW